MHIERLSLKNWLRYEGLNEIALEPVVYGVVARLDGDAERSNWLGKTSILEAVRFALSGKHRWRTEDDWITKGQRDGEVALDLSSGVRVVRKRTRGKSTQLELHVPGKDVANQEAAQRELDALVGLAGSDFDNTCWFEQKGMSRFVEARPSARMEVVGAWLDLGPLRDAEESARRELGALVTQDGKLALQLRGIDGSLAEVCAEISENGGEAATEEEQVAWYEARIVARAEAAEAAKAAAAALKREIDAAREWEANEYRAKQYDVLHAKLVEHERVAGPEKVDAEAMASASGRSREETVKAREARGELGQKRRLAAGNFDGRCPIAGIDCPAKDEINADRTRNAKLLEEATVACEEAERRERAAAADEEKLRVERQAFETRKREGVWLREKVAEMKPAFDARTKGKPPRADVHADYEANIKAASKAEADVAYLRRVLERLAAVHVRVRELNAERKKIVAKLETVREAVAILGANGAQRRIAERELGVIEEGANALLTDSGIDLRVAVRWGRETKGLARACYACGAPFGSSAKTKACERCGEPRGNQVEERLDLELSDRSGAAEDLAGVAFELSAAGWLRRRRDVAWSVALVDEPFSALDASCRRALSLALQRMLRSRYGFAQAFIVSHTSDVDDYAGRIVVRASGARSRLEVEA